MIKLNSWGRLCQQPHQIQPLTDRHQLSGLFNGNTPGLAYGMGRSYGDSCLNPQGKLWLTRGLDKFISFDEKNGRLVCEAGVLLREIQQLLIPRGWALPVTPGTEEITVGGAIANDVHGKNHHQAGNFSHHVNGFKLLRSDSNEINCCPEKNPDWFKATVGGLGLTGLITEVELQLEKIDGNGFDMEIVPFHTLEEFFNLSITSENRWNYSVAWVDCLTKNYGRGIFFRANRSQYSEIKPPANNRIVIPFSPFFSIISPRVIKSFNQSYFQLKKQQSGKHWQHYQSFLYPLDAIGHWNKLYGSRGFYQYQCLIPETCSLEVIQCLLDEIHRFAQGSFLAVLKTFGKIPACGLMSFPGPGTTLALDFPNQSRQTERLFKRLDDIVKESHGRIYPAKDARMPANLFESGYPALNQFINYRDPAISSAFSRRVMGF